ncbi:hypothetical protein BDQ12DRAFT_687965 [Crucibulum laeve]|uniref:UDENN domain-containing protein n=1 Tax=Crucibulum laeve TaxID=68775 RepID=A0A5C3LT53_9AGAR|nr:hypothetical protein BDQ12DRAFT_687965 [Crucibulum laeve]
MPPRRTSLRLENPIEADIGEQSPYLPVASAASSRTSATTSSTTTPIFNLSDSTPSKPNFPDELDIHLTQNLSRKLSAGPLNSPSSPSLATRHRPQQLHRSSTLPRSFQLERAPRTMQLELDKLAIDQETVQKMRRWILGIAVVEFDIDDGPTIDAIFPPLQLLPAESENIAFSAFPDSLQFDQGSQCHSFRIREQWTKRPNEKRPRTEDGFLYGYSHFTQKRDAASKRGYQQRSLVILTHLPYPALFSSLVSIFGPLFQSHGTPMLEAACHNIATWRDPTPGATLELGFLGSVLQVEIPHTVDEQQLTDTSSFNEKYDPRLHILASTAPMTPPPILLFEAALPNLWSIWECLVLCEPILVFGTSPAQTSQAIWWFRDLMRPIPLAGDIRPYITMQDVDHASLVNKLPPKAGLLLGVTNPFFEKSCAHWPHVLSLGKRMPPSSAGPKSASMRPAGPAPGWKTRTHKRHISKDRALLKNLEHAIRGSELSKMNASLLLRRHFCSRTTELITPLHRYLNTLIPTPSEVKSARARGTTSSLRLKPFNNANFFASLKAHGSTLPFKSTSKRTEFYERWLKSPAFGTWLAQQEHIVQRVLCESGGGDIP